MVILLLYYNILFVDIWRINSNAVFFWGGIQGLVLLHPNSLPRDEQATIYAI